MESKNLHMRVRSFINTEKIASHSNNVSFCSFLAKLLNGIQAFFIQTALMETLQIVIRATLKG